MADKAGDLALIFGGGSSGGSGDAAPAGGPSGDAGDEHELGEGDGLDEDAPPPDFAVHVAEAFPELATDDARIDALYRAIKACHPVV